MYYLLLPFTFQKAFCAYCHDRIWGLGRQGFKCIQCKLLVHKKCHKMVQKTCTNEHQEPIMKERDVSLTENAKPTMMFAHLLNKTFSFVCLFTFKHRT